MGYPWCPRVLDTRDRSFEDRKTKSTRSLPQDVGVGGNRKTTTGRSKLLVYIVTLGQNKSGQDVIMNSCLPAPSPLPEPLRVSGQCYESIP